LAAEGPAGGRSGARSPNKLAVYRICENRHEDRARELLASSTAIITTDRWWAYNHLPLHRRQICWSHLRRDFTAHAESGGAERELGEVGLRVCEEVFLGLGDLPAHPASARSCGAGSPCCAAS